MLGWNDFGLNWVIYCDTLNMEIYTDSQKEPIRWFKGMCQMNYRKFDKAMQKSGVEYNIEEKDVTIHIQTEPDKNDIAQSNIEPALGKYETCINSSPGKFNVIETDVRVYKIRVEQREDLES